MSTIVSSLQSIKAQLPEDVTLVAVSKTKPSSDILEAYATGQRDFGENKIQEMTSKWEELPKDINWHMIGHVQTNKVKYMAPFVHLIHAVDSFKLLKEINKQAKKNNRSINCLIQIKIAEEDSKFGLSTEDAVQLILSPEVSQLSNINIRGLMGMATFTDDEKQLRSEFKIIKSAFDELKNKIEGFNTLSIGMSGDYQIAIQEGGTMVRIGSSIFGERNYQH
ncbi:MAG: YggS family pyridoxal phosphate-dependent enzyme [Aquimarina sp.]|nr:YggS family pyridoxal phosphate-dependent enzyme [Aquimarina sp.]